MPNHCFNTLLIEGSARDIQRFEEKAGMPHANNHESFEKNDVGVIESIRTEGVHDTEFSFWNFVSPAPEMRDIYFGIEKDPKQLPDDRRNIQTISREFEILDGWYHWNVRNWGTKWDAYDIEIHHQPPTNLLYTFTTAWSPPEALFSTMIAQHPELYFALEYEEETGWGGKITASNGELIEASSYEESEPDEEEALV